MYPSRALCRSADPFPVSWNGGNDSRKGRALSDRSCDLGGIFICLHERFAVFRGLGETKKCLHLSILINVLHFVASFVFINILKLDIMGSALSLNLARLVGGMAAVLMLISKKSSIEIRPRHVFRIDWRIQKEIFRIGIPCGMEQLFMNGGAMLVSGLHCKTGNGERCGKCRVQLDLFCFVCGHRPQWRRWL